MSNLIATPPIQIPNLRLREGAFLESIVRYADLASQSPELAWMYSFNLQFAQAKLTQRLIGKSALLQGNDAAGTTRSSLHRLELRLIPPPESLSLSEAKWWRVDFCVSLTVKADPIVFKIQLNGEPVELYPEVDANTGTGSLLIWCDGIGKIDSLDQSIIEGEVKTDAGAISFEAICLNDQSAVVQHALISHLKVGELSSVGELLSRSLNGLKAAQTSQYLNFYKQRLFSGRPLSKQQSLYIKSCSDAFAASCSALGLQADVDDLDENNRLESRDKLSGLLQFNVEGVKEFCGLYVVFGWVIDRGANLSHLFLRLSAGEPGKKPSLEALDTRLVKFERKDVKQAFKGNGESLDTIYGFVAAVRTKNQPCSNMPLSAEFIVKDKSGKYFVEALTVENLLPDDQGLQTLLGLIPSTSPTKQQCDLYYRDLFEAYAKHTQRAFEYSDIQIGESFMGEYPPSRSGISIVIPLYGSTRFELTQLPLLSTYRAMWQEIMIAVDDPSIYDEVKANCVRLSALYGLPIRLVMPERNLGFAGINNLAARLSKADTLLFLNSDCFVSEPTPILKAKAHLDNPQAGAVGFRLLYADEKIQHDGMSCGVWNSDPAFLINEHPGIGTPIELVSRDEFINQSSMLTAACLLIKKSTFEAVGGFNTQYVRGDFEDSDLCLKLIQAGKTLAIVKSGSIYHLERQTIGGQTGWLRQKITLINSYLYTRLWSRTLSSRLPKLEIIQ